MDDGRYDRLVFLYHTPEDLRRGAALEADAGRFHMAEHYAGQLLDSEPHDAVCLNVMGRIGLHAKRYAAAARFFRRALAANSAYKPARKGLAQAEAALSGGANRSAPAAPPRYLLIREWGAGFWSDVDHVLGQLLVAEITGRVPIVHWGPGSRFGDGSEADAWARYFEPVSGVGGATLADLSPLHAAGDVAPAKWKSVPLTGKVPNRWSGPGSRTNSLDVMASGAAVVVSDFHYGVCSARDWLEPDHPMHGKDTLTIYRWLCGKYLRPRADVLAAVDAFVAGHLAPPDARPALAVHVRGTDKQTETSPFGDLSALYPEHLDAMNDRHQPRRMFLMTDEAAAAEHFTRTFGERVCMTGARRGGGPVGIHFDAAADGLALGREVLIDALIATRCDCFVGFGPSNVTGMILALKEWPAESVTYVGPNYLLIRKPGVYTVPVVAER